jgi:hypothetical protein
VNAKTTNVEELCAKNSNGTSVCVTCDQLAAQLTGGSTIVGASPVPSASVDATTTPSIIQINGNNPAYIYVGDSYGDLGATATDVAGHDLGLKCFLNGALVSNIMLDTSAVATDTIDYVATDTWGNTATSTRTVIIEAPAFTIEPEVIPDAGSATSTAQ